MPKYNKDKREAAVAYHHGDLRSELIRGGTRLLESQGGANFSLREVARSAGVSASAPYRHFPDREALLVAIAAEGYRSAAQVLTGDAGEAAAALASFGASQPSLWQLMVAQPSRGGDALEGARGDFLAELVGVVERSALERDPELAIRKAVAIWAQVVGMVQLTASGSLGLLDGTLLPAVDVVAEVLVSRRRLGAADGPLPGS